MSLSSPLLLDGRALLDADRLLDAGLADRRASFELTFRAAPPHAAYLVIAGVESALAILSGSLVNQSVIESAQKVVGFSDKLAERLYTLTPTFDVDAMSDGAIAFPGAPIATVEGPFLEASLFASILRATTRRATAIATRASRLHTAAAGDLLLDASSAHAASPESSLLVARSAFVGGVGATTNVIAAMALGIPFRAAPGLVLGQLGPAAETTVNEDAWGTLDADALFDLGAGDDEEAMLVEAKRRGRRVGGWMVRGLDEAPVRALGMRCELVALEEAGAWAPPPADLGAEDAPRPGRKMVARYTDAAGQYAGDMIFLMAERMRSPREMGAVTLSPLARPRVRGGRTLELPEAPSVGRERAMAGRKALPDGVGYLRSPVAYRLEESQQVAMQREAAAKARGR